MIQFFGGAVTSAIAIVLCALLAIWLVIKLRKVIIFVALALVAWMAIGKFDKPNEPGKPSNDTYRLTGGFMMALAVSALVYMAAVYMRDKDRPPATQQITQPQPQPENNQPTFKSMMQAKERFK
jgi:hypothetical protein